MAETVAGILSTGTEILQGLYADTNGAWLSEQLTGLGLRVVRHVAAPDDASSVAEALRYLARNCQVVIMTGGLGPTDDDLTRQSVCEVFGVGLTEDPRAWAMIEERFRRRGIAPFASNRVQALIPQGACTLYNEWGTAPGFLIEHPGKGLPWFAALPGPPREMRPMFEKHLRKRITKDFGKGHVTRIMTLHTFGHAESQLNDLLRNLFEQTRNDPHLAIAYLASDAKVDIRLVAHGQTARGATRRIEGLAARVKRLLPPGAVYGEGEETLEEIVSALLRERGFKLATAESCTGGLVAKRITDLAGSSEVFAQGWVTYSNESKQTCLGVRNATLNRYGAVSRQVAEEMALGALKRSGADIAVAITGIAGPGGGTEEKPVGTVWYGIAWDRKVDGGHRESPARTTRTTSTGQSVASTITMFASGRDLVRAFAAHRGLDLVRRLLTGLPLEFGDF